MRNFCAGSFLASVAILAIVTVSVHGQQVNNCTNPLFSGNSNVQGALASSTSPVTAPQDVSTACPNIPVGAPSCCGSNTPGNFKSGFDNFRRGLKTQVDAFHNQKSAYQSILQSVRNNRNAFLVAFRATNPNAPDSQFLNQYDAFLNEVQFWLGNYTQSLDQCVGAVLKTAAGMFCFACDPNWHQYITFNSTFIKVKLARNTCDQLRAGCSNLFDGITNFYGSFRNLFQLAGLTLPNAGPDNACGGKKCNQFVCSSMLKGATPSMPTMQSLPDPGNLLGGGQSTQQSDGAQQAVLSIYEETRQILSQGHIHDGSQVVTRSTEVENEYTSSGGYTAYSTGSSSSSSTFDTSSSGVTSDSGSSSNSASTAQASVTVLVVAVVSMLASLVVVA